MFYCYQCFTAGGGVFVLVWFVFFLYIKSSEFLVLEIKHQGCNKYGLLCLVNKTHVESQEI